MDKITFTNSKGQSVEIGENAPFILTKIEGAGAAELEIHTQKSPHQDGVSHTNSTLKPRDIAIEVMVLANNMEEMAINRQKLLQVFNSKLGEGELIYEMGSIKRKINAISELAPIFPERDRNFKDVMQAGLIQLYCFDPFWLDIHTSSKELRNWIGGMRFPLKLPVSFSMAGAKKTNIFNNGDVETPIRLEIVGTATNPKILNNTTGEFIKINKTLTIDDTLIITTDFGNKRVEQNETNVFNYIDADSTFFNLQTGDNIIELLTDDISDDASAKITYRNRYIGV